MGDQLSEVRSSLLKGFTAGGRGTTKKRNYVRPHMSQEDDALTVSMYDRDKIWAGAALQKLP